jgi:hypothetical protein
MKDSRSEDYEDRRKGNAIEDMAGVVMNTEGNCDDW